MICLHNHDQILEFLRKIFLKGFQIYQNYLCALSYLCFELKLFMQHGPALGKTKAINIQNSVLVQIPLAGILIAIFITRALYWDYIIISVWEFNISH